MKKIIRLTESDLHNIVKKSVNKILRESFDRWTEKGSCYISDKFLEAVAQVVDEDVYDSLNAYVSNNPKAFYLIGVFDVGYDDETGYGDKNSLVYELRDVKGKDKAMQYLMNFQTDPQTLETIIQIFNNVVINLDETDFGLGEEY